MNKCKKRYIDSDAWVERLKEEREETTNDKRKLYLTTLINAIDCRPTIDEKEIIRKTVERIVERLEKRHLNHVNNIFKYQEVKDFDSCSRTSNIKVENEIAIEIVKEEGGIE